jgi:hypothetical protein
MLAVLFAVPTIGFRAQQPQSSIPQDLYDLYYAELPKKGALAALVISPNGEPIPRKQNDPDDPTRPGFYLDDQRFAVASSEITAHGFEFRTDSVAGIEFCFRGSFGREDVEDIPAVPYLAGVLVERRHRRIVRKKTKRFARAVIL